MGHYENRQNKKRFFMEKRGTTGKMFFTGKLDLVCKPKKLGELGVIDLRTFNDALLAKSYWFWIKPEMRLWKSLLVAIYNSDRPSSLPDCKFFSQTLRNVQAFCHCYMTRTIGDGSTIQFWNHNWGQGLLYSIFPELYKITKDQSISFREFIQTQNILELFNNGMSEDAEKELFEPQHVLEEQSTNHARQDGVSWNLASSGIFSVNSAYLGIKNVPMIMSQVHRIWKLKVPPRIQVFGWLVHFKKILTAENLQKRGWNMPSMCVLCRSNCESIVHLFSECPFVMDLYDATTIEFGMLFRDWRMIMRHQGAHQWIVKKEEDMKTKEIILLSMFICWRERCNRIFRDRSKEIQVLVEEVQQQWQYLH